MKVSEVMTKDVVTVDPEITVDRLAVKLSERRIGSAVVVRCGKPVGIVTERDIVSKVVTANLVPSKTKVSEILKRKVITITGDEKVSDAFVKMKKSHIRRFPVVDSKGKLVGIITDHDIAYASQLVDVLEEKMNIKVNPVEDRPMSDECESCGNFGTLYFIDGQWLCEECAEERKKSRK